MSHNKQFNYITQTGIVWCFTGYIVPSGKVVSSPWKAEIQLPLSVNFKFLAWDRGQRGPCACSPRTLIFTLCLPPSPSVTSQLCHPIPVQHSHCTPACSCFLFFCCPLWQLLSSIVLHCAFRSNPPTLEAAVVGNRLRFYIKIMKGLILGMHQFHLHTIDKISI